MTSMKGIVSTGCACQVFLTTFRFNVVIKTIQLLKQYKTLSMHNNFINTFPFVLV